MKRIRNIILIVLAAIIGLVLCAYLLLLGRGGSYYNEDGSFVRIEANHSFNYIMQHPALEGMGEDVLPLGSDLLRTVCGPWKLKIMIPFLGKHEQTVVDGLNYAIEQAEAGQTEYVRFYSTADIEADSAKADTGLLYYKTAEGAPFVIVAPGG